MEDPVVASAHRRPDDSRPVRHVGTSGYERAVEILGERLALEPKFRWKLKTVPFGLDRPVWVEDTEFDPRPPPAPGRSARPGGQERECRGPRRDHVEAARSTNPRCGEYWYLDGLAHGRVGVVLKFHHCLLDGVSGASLATVLMDLAPDAPPPEPPGCVGSSRGASHRRWSCWPSARFPTCVLPNGCFVMAGNC